MRTERAEGTDRFGLVGQTLAGRFHVERQIAEGGFGVIYRAQQLALARAVALKVLKTPAGLTVDQVAAFHETFEGEARTIARLKHPNIVEVHDFGVTDVGASRIPLPWIAFEWLDGQTLEGLLEQRRRAGEGGMTPALALQLLRPVFAAIAFAHAQNVAHRDIKPGNIFLAQTHGTTVAKVLDFGIAKLMAADADGGKGGNTTRGLPAFSPDYAAPEQLSQERTGSATDVYALGLLLTEVLTGTSPHDRAKGAWEPVLAKALARRPEERYPDAAAFLEALGPGGRVPARRPMGIKVGVAATLLALAGTFAIMAWRSRDGTSTRTNRVTLAVLPFENLTRDPQQDYFSDGLTDEMIGQLGRVAPKRLAVIGRTSVLRYKQAKKSIGEIGRELHVDYVLESSVNRSADQVRISAHLVQVKDETQVWGERYDRSVKDVLVLQTEITQAIANSVRTELAPAESADRGRQRPIVPAAYEAYLRGRFFLLKFAPEAEHKAASYFEQAIAIDPGYADAYAGLSDSIDLLAGGQGARPQDVMPKARAAALRALELDENSAEAHFALSGVLLHYDWDFAGAERHVKRGIELDPNHEGCHIRYGRYLMALGRFDEALAELRRAVELSPLSPPANTFLGDIYGQVGQNDRAIAQLRRTIELAPDFLISHYILEGVYEDKGMFKEALAELELTGPPGVDNIGDYATFYARTGRRAQAEGLLRRMEEMARNSLLRAIVFASVHAALDHRDQAFAWLEKALQNRDDDLIFLKIDSAWTSLRGDPRFADLVRRVGIP
jgi:TolB-like protein